VPDLHDLVPLYAVDALDDIGRRRFEAHLAECVRCREELKVLDAAVDRYVSDDGIAAPPDLKAAVLAAIEDTPQERSSVRRTPIMVAVASVAAVVALLLAVALRPPDPVDQVVAASDAVTVTVEGGDLGTVHFVFSADLERAVLIADGLPDPGEGRTYEVWLIGDDGPRPAGTFVPRDGSASVLIDGEATVGLMVGLTIEPEGGSEVPTGDVLMTADLA